MMRTFCLRRSLVVLTAVALAALGSVGSAAASKGSVDVACYPNLLEGPASLAAHPTDCALSVGKSFALGDVYLLKQMHWTDWGSAQTTGRGLLASDGMPAPERRVTVRLGDIATCHGKRMYTLLENPAALDQLAPARLKSPCYEH
jgi:hypothetical protein